MYHGRTHPVVNRTLDHRHVRPPCKVHVREARLHGIRDVFEPVQELVLLATTRRGMMSACVNSGCTLVMGRTSPYSAPAVRAIIYVSKTALARRWGAYDVRVDEAGHQELAELELDEVDVFRSEPVARERILQRARVHVVLDPRDVARVARYREQRVRQRAVLSERHWGDECAVEYRRHLPGYTAGFPGSLSICLSFGDGCV